MHEREKRLVETFLSATAHPPQQCLAIARKWSAPTSKMSAGYRVECKTISGARARSSPPILPWSPARNPRNAATWSQLVLCELYKVEVDIRI